MIRRLLRVFLIILGVLAVLLLVLMMRLGTVIKTAINEVGPRVLGVPVSVQEVRVLPLRGELRLKQFQVGNPPGFSTPCLFELESLRVEVDMRSILSEKLHVREIIIAGPRVWYERTASGSNVARLQEMLARDKDGQADTPAAEGPKRRGKPVVIDRVLVKQGRVGLKMVVGGELPLPAIELRDIGKDEPGGVAWRDALKRIFQAILGSVTNVLAGAGQLVGEGVKAVGAGLQQGGKAVGEGLGKVGGGAGATGKAVGDAVKKGLDSLLGD